MKTKQEKPFFSIQIKHTDGKIGWIVGPDKDILKFDTLEEADQWLKKAKKNSNYSWNCNVSAQLFKGYSFQYE